MSGWWWWIPGGVLDTSGSYDDRESWIQLPEVNLAGARWAGEVWRDEPVFAPRRVDVAEFLGQDPLPYVWPDEPAYVESVDKSGNPTDRLLTDWLYAFLHHPDPDVIVDALEQPRIGADELFLGPVTDLLTLHRAKRVRQEAARAVWRHEDRAVRRILHAVRQRASARDASGHVRDAEARVLAARPDDRPVPDPGD